jgi:hypothetical protein
MVSQEYWDDAGGMNVTPQAMKLFAVTCIEWASEERDPSNRTHMIAMAKFWLRVAKELDIRVSWGAELLEDLRTKLN